MLSAETIARLQRELAAAPLALSALFGSSATNRMHADSDVDIGILPTDADWPLGDELALQGRLSAIVGRDVDLVRLDRADLLVGKQVAQKGKPLYEASAGAFARYAARAMLDYLDLEPLIVEGQRRYLRSIGRKTR